jgi:large subunit ribosomal protein L4e
MKLNILDKDGKSKGEQALPKQFTEEVRPDLIKKAVVIMQANKRQPYGAYVRAGQRHSSYVSKRRNSYKSTYGIGQSRTPRKVMSRRGTRMNWEGATVPQAVGGRKAHPPKATKIFKLKMNIKERRKAIRSAIAATIIKDLVVKRGHKIPPKYPFIIDKSFESLKKTKDINDALKKLGLTDEIKRVSIKKVRSGKGKNRGRKYKSKKGPIIITSNKCNLEKAVNNLEGFDIVCVNNLNTELLAPGTSAGRLALWTNAAIEKLEKENLFYNNHVEKVKDINQRG